MKIKKFNPIKKKDTLLIKLFILVGGLFAAGLLILGGMVISEIILEPETAFEAPPPPEKVEKKKTFQHKPQQKQQSSSKLIKRIQIPQAKMNNISTAHINLPSSDVAGTSLTGGLAPKGLGDLKIPMTTVNLMGLSGKTEKIVILLDTSRYMMADKRGALDTYNVIKADITKLVNSLPPAILFNVIAYADPDKGPLKINAFSQTGLVSASQENKDKLFQWLDPINSSLSTLEVQGTYKARLPFMPQAPAAPKTKGGYNPELARIYRAYHAAMEQGADTVYILTAKWTPPAALKRPWSDADKAEYAKDLAKAKQAFAKRHAEWKEIADGKREAYSEAKAAIAANMTEEERAAAAAKAKEVAAAKAKAAAELKAANAKAEAESRAKAKAWIAKENAARAKAGKSLFVGTIDQVIVQQGFQANTSRKRGGKRIVPPEPKFNPPPMDTNKGYTGAEMAKYYAELIQNKNGLAKPTKATVNMIIFRGVDEDVSKLKELAERFCSSHNHGKVRVLTGTKL